MFLCLQCWGLLWRLLQQCYWPLWDLGSPSTQQPFGDHQLSVVCSSTLSRLHQWSGGSGVGRYCTRLKSAATGLFKLRPQFFFAVLISENMKFVKSILSLHGRKLKVLKFRTSYCSDSSNVCFIDPVCLWLSLCISKQFQMVPMFTGGSPWLYIKSFFFSDCPNVYWIGGSPGLYIKSVSARRGLGKGIDVRGWKSCRRFSLELQDYGTNTDSDLPIAIE